MKLKTPKVPESLKDEVEFVEKPEFEIGENPDVFYFTNASDEDFTTQWNKLEYTFPAGKTVRMYIQSETPENVQNIRKMFAYRFAQREFFKTKQFNAMTKMGNGLPPIYDDKVLQPWIDQCLKSLPQDKLKVSEIKDNQESKYKSTKPVSKSMTLNEQFKDEEIIELGAM